MRKSNKQQAYVSKLNSLNNKLSHPKKVNRDEATIFTRQALDEIAIELDYLQKEGLKFRHKLIKREEMMQQYDTMTARHIRRVVKLRFRCVNQRCSEYQPKVSRDQKSQEYRRHWTSYYGLVSLKFYFEKIPNKNLSQLNYSFFLYKQKCKACRQWGKSGIIQSCFIQLLQLYRLLIQQCLVKIKERKQESISWGVSEKMGNNPEMKGAFNGHLSHLCEACQLQECLRFFELKEIKQEQNEQKVKKEQDEFEYIASNDIRGRYR